MLEKKDFTEKTRKVITYCYNFWLTSSNGLNCFIEQEIYEADGELEILSENEFEDLFNRVIDLMEV